MLKQLLKYAIAKVFISRLSSIRHRELSGKNLSKIDQIVLDFQNRIELKAIVNDNNYDPSKKWMGKSGDNFWMTPEHLFPIDEYENDKTYRRPFLEMILQLAKEKKIENFTELGCGTGNNLGYLSKIFPNGNFIGFDANQFIIDAAQKEWPNITFKVGNIQNEINSFEMNSNSVLFSSAVLMYFNEQNIIQLLNKISYGTFFALNEPYIEDILKHDGPMVHSNSSFFHNYENYFISCNFNLIAKSLRKTHNNIKIISLLFQKVY